MTKKLLSVLLAAILVLMLLPVFSFAETPSDWDLLKMALAGETEEGADGVYSYSVQMELIKTITLLKDIDAGSDDITVSKDIFLNLNGHDLKTTGKITNEGTIDFSQENAALADTVFWKVPGAYGTDGELILPDTEKAEIVIPDNTFFTVESGENPSSFCYQFAIGDEYLVWNRDVFAGTQIEVTYAVALGGDLLSAEGNKTSVTANRLKLEDDIAIGSHEDGSGEAVLSVESIYDDLFGNTVGTFDACGKTITINKTGKFVISSDISFDESVLKCVEEGMEIQREENAEDKTVTYSLQNAGNPVPSGETQKSSSLAPVLILAAAALVAVGAGIFLKKKK